MSGVRGDDDTIAGTVPGAPPEDSDLESLVAGRYRIVRWLGGGGMGRVYEAIDIELGENVALKMLRGGLSDDAVERFRREVRLTRRIQHRNVARMFDIGDHRGARFLTMELVMGEPLTRAVATPWPRLKKLAHQICEGLAAAHAANVVHRDLKPDNVLVERTTERAVITDFGIARSLDDAGVTHAGTVIGTPRYMAPEQLAGREVDARADLFSLGVMLFELATGTRPWSGDNAITIAVAQATQPARPFATRAAPREFGALVDRLLALDPAQRPASAHEVAAALATLPDTVEDAARARTTPPLPTPTLTQSPLTTISEGTTLTVLPFSAGAADAYLADGIHEDLVDTLSNTRSLKVRPAGAAVTGDPREVGVALGVDHVVVGSLRRIPTGLRIAARMIGVADGFQIWAQRVDCTEAEVLAVSEQLGRAIAQALSTRAAAIDRPTDPRAVELYLRARAELRRFWGEHARAAAELLTEAAALSPTSAPILSALAFALVQSWIKLGDPALGERARAAVERALATGHGEALLASALLRNNLDDLEGAAGDLGRALIRTPMSAAAHEIAGRLLCEVSPPADARRHFATALALDPTRSQMIASDVARLDAFEGDFESAYRWLAEIQQDPDSEVRAGGALYESRIASWQRDTARMLHAFDQFGDRLTGSTAATKLLKAWLGGASFEAAKFRAMLAQVAHVDRSRRIQLVALQRATETLALVGQDDLAIEIFDQAAGLGLIDIVWVDRCPLFTELRAHPAWQATRARVATRAAAVRAAFDAAR
jgi:serine/threonine protein kinase